jgi:hypothetical protein
MTLYDGIKWTIRKWNRYAQPRMMPVKGKGRKTVAYGLAGVIFGAPFLFANPNSTTADVHLQLQLPDGYIQMGTIGGTATDIATGQVAMVGVPNIDAGRIDFYKLNTPVKKRGSDLPSKYDLSQNNPNPFNPTTNMQYNLPKPENVRIDVLNSLGQRVKTLVDENIGAGMHDVRWDGTDDFSRGVSAGLYFARMSAGDYTEVKKMIKSDGTNSGGGIFAPRLAKAAGVNDSGVEYRFDVYGANIDSTSLIQRIVNDTTMVVPVQERITVNPWSFVFNEGDSSQVDLGQKVNAGIGISGYRLENVNGKLVAVVNGNYLKVKGTDGDVNGTNLLSELVATGQHGTEKRYQFPTTINPMTDIPIRTFDVQYLKERMAGTAGGIPGSVMIDGRIYSTDANGLLNVQVSPRDCVEVKVSTTKDNNPDSFASLFWVPVKADYSKMLNIPVVSYDSLSYNTTIPISPQTFKDFAGEGVFNPQNGADYPGMKGFDWTRKYKEWISAGQTETEYPTVYKTYTTEQQQQIAQLIRQLQHPSFVDSLYIPRIEVASPQDTLPHVRIEGYARPQRGYLWISPRKMVPLMGFKGYDYDNDGIMDAGQINITDFDDISGIKQEFNSKFVLGPINSDSMRGKTVFHERQV